MEERLSAFERKFEELRSSLMRILEERLEIQPRLRAMPPIAREVEHKRKKKDAKRPVAAKAPRTSQRTPTGGPVQETRKMALPPIPRSSGVTLTLNEGTKTS